MRFLQPLRLLALVAVLSLASAACGGADDAGDTTTPTDTGTPTADGAAAGELDLVNEGVLTVCTDAPYPPMEYEEAGEFTGFDIELMRAIAEQIGLDGIEVINAGFEPITSGAVFAADQCDVAASSITILEEREENVDFSDPYFEAEQSLLVAADSQATSLEDLAGERLGVEAGTTGETYAQDNAPDTTEIVSFDAAEDLFGALAAGDIAGVLQDLVVNQDRVENEGDVKIVETFPTDEQYGFAVAEEGSEDLLAAVNDALATVREDGTYDEIYDRFFPQDEV